MTQSKKSYMLLLLLGLNSWIFFQSLYQTNSDLEDPISNISTIQIGSIINKLTEVQSFIPHAPISITSDSQLNSTFPGGCTFADPCRIEGYNITASSGSLTKAACLEFPPAARNT